MSAELVDWTEYQQARLALGEAFFRILGYFRHDGMTSVAAIEQAMRARDAAALVIPAHTLKGESRQFGAIRIGDMAEEIEMTARHCVETHEDPEELLHIVGQLRDCFEQSLALLEQDASPILKRKPTFGRKGSLSA